MLRLDELYLQNCENIRELFKNYLRKAFKFYAEPLGFSKMLLTLLKLICALDKKTTQKFSLLKEHKLGISPTLIHSMPLPLKNDMELATELEEYFSRRQSASLPPLIGERHISEHSYSVRHSQHCQQMQECKRTLLEMVSKTKNNKEGVEREKRAYEAISKEISKQHCLCTDSTNNSPACKKCCKEAQDRIRMRLYMYMYEYTSRLPAEELSHETHSHD